MTPHDRPPSVSVAGWTVTLLDLGAIYAPLTWVFPDGFGRIERADDGTPRWVDLA